MNITSAQESLESQRLRLQEELRQYSQISSRCLNACLNSMTRKEITPSQETCLENCYRKTQKFNDALVMSINSYGMAKQV
jgi:hypothetical protein